VEDRFPAAGEAGHPAGRPDFRHLAFFYRDAGEYAAGVGGFIRDALARAEAVFVAVPPARAGPLAGALGAAAARVDFADMTELGRNPGRIIAAVCAFAGRHPGQQVCCVGEPAWPGRSGPELREAARHEALVNQAFAALPVTSLCPYDRARLPPAALADAELTHPALMYPDGTRPSPGYLGPGALPPGCEAPLPPPPPGAGAVSYHRDLQPVRELAAAHAARAGLAPDRAADLVLAVSELAANTLRHTAGGGTAACWQAAGELLCEVRDRGWIGDPLAGRRSRQADAPGGHGLWLVHQVCDLVELRTGPAGTTIRLHLRLAH
jgi:anti-sigma regulatory factor (Ser/Thr protein kinase)